MDASWKAAAYCFRPGREREGREREKGERVGRGRNKGVQYDVKRSPTNDRPRVGRM
jgi:hypothetical protein